MSEALDRVVEALAGMSEEEVAAALAAVGASVPSPVGAVGATRTQRGSRGA